MSTKKGIVTKNEMTNITKAEKLLPKFGAL